MPKSKIMQITVGSVSMTADADFFSESTSELLYGEQVEILGYLEDDDGEPWVEVINLGDGYQGYLAQDALGEDLYKPTHKVSVLRSFVYPEPDVKTLPILALSFSAPVHVMPEAQDGFVRLKNSGWVWKDHLIKASETCSDYATTAEKFIGTPYLWGGRTSFGLDCSALVQLSLAMAGHACPRDTQDQVKTGTDLPKSEALQRGDVVYFRGHVGIMVDSKRIVNASARTMETRTEKLSDLVKAYKGIVAVKRF